MRVAEAYRPGALTCTASAPVAEAARTMMSAQVGALAVLDDNVVVGVLSERDVVRAVAEQLDLDVTPAAALASPNVQTAQVSEDTADVARRMLDAGIRHLPVVQGHTVIGMISMRDLLAVELWA